MSKPAFRVPEIPLLPAFFAAVLCLGGAVHGHPQLLRPVLGAVAALPHLL